MSELETEEWRPVVGYEGLYMVSNLGNFRNLKYDRDLKPHVRLKYLKLGLYKESKCKYHFAHRLVLEAFIGPPPTSKHVTRHLNGNPQDNRLENLKWGTQKENYEDTVRHGINKAGDRHGCAKLTKAQVIEIRKRYIPRCPINGASAMARAFGVCAPTVRGIVRGETWKSI